MATTLLDFKVTHIDPEGLKRVRVVHGSAGAGAAMDWVEQLMGPARALSAIRLEPAAKQSEEGGL
jgi:hypothetical protein